MPSLPQLQFTEAPDAVYKVQQEYTEEGPVKTHCPNSNFLKGAKWSPDGACLLTASDDNWLRVYDLPTDVLEAGSLGTAADVASGKLAAAPDSFEPALRMQEGELVYDYTWYPQMLASEPVSCCFATTCRAHPIHLWDACTGQVRCTYRAYNDKDEVTAANSLAFSLDGGKLYSGHSRSIRVFDVATPGRVYGTITTHQKRQEGLPGLVSTMVSNPDRSGVLAAGSYAGVAALYDERTLALQALFYGHTAGITQVLFSKDGNYLYSGARCDPQLLCWDIRYSSEALYCMRRASSTTNQRIHFDIEPCGRHLGTGGEDGMMRVFDLRDGTEIGDFPAATDTVNGFEFHPCLPYAVSASGHRRFALDALDEDEEDEDEATIGNGTSDMLTDRKHTAGALRRLENCLVVWKLGCIWPQTEAGDDPVDTAILQH